MIQETFISDSPAMRPVHQRIRSVAPSDTSVLLQGETGTGKGVTALHLHLLSRRAQGPFVCINCGAIPENLIETELFGHERGAFTGAERLKPGKVEIAQGGTLFLDEVADLSPAAQVKLLHLVEERTYERIGGIQPQVADVRVIAATNRDVHQMMEAAAFREDLYYRLQGIVITLPPLRQRREDIPAFIRLFIARSATHMGKPVPIISPTAERALRDYAWPGNVRELKNIIAQAVLICTDQVIRPEDIALPTIGRPGTNDAPMATLEDVGRQHILHVLEQTDWVIKGAKGAAQILGLHPATLHSRMKKWGIERRRGR